MTKVYHFNVPAYLVWSSHILIGIFLIYVGYSMYLNRTNNSICKRVPDYVPIVLIVLGVLASLYHAHIWLVEKSEQDEEKK